MVSLAALSLIVLLAGTELLFTGLDVLNLKHGARAVRESESWVRESLDVDDPDRMLAYQRQKTTLSRVQSWLGVALVLAVVVSGLFGDVVGMLTETGRSTVLQGVGLLIGAVVLSRLVGAPFDLYETFVVEERFGFNNQTLGLWVRDFVIGLVISVAFSAVIGGVVLAAVERLPTLWPVAGWAIVVGFSLLMMVVYPRFIAPLFNDFDPIESGPLRDAVDDVFDRAGFECEQVYEMDASRRSSHSNAYFVGFGETKRVVLFDTLVEQMDHDSVQAVLAHELAHWKRGHIWKQLGASAVQMGVVFGFLWWITTSQWVYAAFSLPSVTYAALAIGLLYAGPVLSLLSPLTNRLSLAHEREADDFAAQTMGESESMTRALTTLAGENLSNPFPHPWYAAFHYSHPPIPERIRRLRDGTDGSSRDESTDSASSV
ncbi:M48 family metallopeptidase [Halogeometricum borinquense]|uniref:M48 family metallopeptidase n=1 Tax=Halogeometricum borinquense TaxID=60847 RepID=A0A6C0UHU2_9EURY|nr:M48 family metallopeptidase [Halogeometricum borinquense]QIB75076.1 M48 family metallopeptidase [Halogeometricum borinquense]QIQ75943.1 M48 family metallopeptidase [Halogeometricum borinquense]